MWCREHYGHIDFKQCIKMLDNNLRLDFVYDFELNEKGGIRCVKDKPMTLQ